MNLIVPDTAQLAVLGSGINDTSLVYRGIRAHVRMGGKHQAFNAAMAMEAALAHCGRRGSR